MRVSRRLHNEGVGYCSTLEVRTAPSTSVALGRVAWLLSLGVVVLVNRNLIYVYCTLTFW